MVLLSGSLSLTLWNWSASRRLAKEDLNQVSSPKVTKFGVSFVSRGDLTETCGAILGFAKCWRHQNWSKGTYAVRKSWTTRTVDCLFASFWQYLPYGSRPWRCRHKNYEKQRRRRKGKWPTWKTKPCRITIQMPRPFPAIQLPKNWCYKHDLAKDSSQLPRFPCLRWLFCRVERDFPFLWGWTK